MQIGGQLIGQGHPVFVVAELSANHHQDLGTALRLVEAAAEAGANAVKLQTYTPDTMTLASQDDVFRVAPGSSWEGRTLYDLYLEACTPWEWYAPIAEAATRAGLILFSTPFDASAVAYLQDMQTPAFKIASFEIIDLPLLRRVAETRKPVIVSTGMATLAEISEAIGTLREHGAGDIALLKCTSAYPSLPADMNLRTIPDLARRFQVPVGLSDHSLDPAVATAAVALGACIVEKHLTLSRAVPGPDSAFSLEPAEFKAMVAAVRATEAALGSVRYGPSLREQASMSFRRSLFVVMPMKEGELFTPANLRVLRPAGGLHSRYLDTVCGRRASQDIPAGTPLRWELVQGSDQLRTT